MPQVRAKFVCTNVNDSPEYQQKMVALMPVTTESEENKSFSKYTPAGNVQLSISYETEASNFFEEGKEYYLDFTKAE